MKSKAIAKCEICGLENKSVKAHYEGGTSRRGAGARFIGIFCPSHIRR